MENSIERFDLLFQRGLELHKRIQLCGAYRNELLNIPIQLFNYFHTILRNELPILPKVSQNEWQNSIKSLKPHWILPYFYWKISRLPCHLHPPTLIFSKFRKAYLWSCSRSLQMEHQLQEILSAFSRKNIPVLVLKGPALGRIVYENPALRPSSDLDLLVKPNDVIEIRSLLINLGYKLQNKCFETFQYSQCEEVYNRGKHYRSVEIHWALCTNLKGLHEKDLSPFFSRALSVSTETTEFWTLDPVDSLIQVALHALEHHPFDMRINWCMDVSFLIQRIILDYSVPTLLKRSKEWKALGAIKDMLQLSNFWIGIPKKKQINEIIPDEDTKHHSIVSFDPFYRINMYLAKCSGLRQTLSMIVRVIFPDADYVQSTYPASGQFGLIKSHLLRWRNWIGFYLLSKNRS